eukprot:3993189-Pyramimonas_sp.AAC.1
MTRRRIAPYGHAPCTPPCLQGAHESGDGYAVRSAQRSREGSTDLRCPHLRHVSQEPTKVATVALFAAPHGA